MNSEFAKVMGKSTMWRLLRGLGVGKELNGDTDDVFSPDLLNDSFIVAAPHNTSVTDAVHAELFDGNNFFFSHLYPEIVLAAMKKIKSNAVRADGMSIKLIKLIVPQLLCVLVHVFNFSDRKSVV